MKKSSIAVAALLTTLSAATIVPVAYATDKNDAQVASCAAKAGCCAAKTGCCAAKPTCCAAKPTCCAAKPTCCAASTGSDS